MGECRREFPVQCEQVHDPVGRYAGFDKKAKMVYEFDAADVGGSYMYPAIVRSFREVGMQFAAMFSYDPVQIA